MSAVLTFLALTAFLVSTGCGYTTQSSLDPVYQSISVSPFYDKTPEYGLQAPLTNAVIRKFVADSRLRVKKPDEADLLLEGVIVDFQRKGLIYDRKDESTQALLVVIASIRLTDRKSGEVLWQEPVVSGETTFYTRAAGLTSGRLRGNAESFMDPVRSFASEEENRAAAEALEQLASEIVYRVLEPW
ncbi:MAG: LptE family protein [Candidatus Hydrogenedens sp.]|nr:LptE family protein [Candidatus Hydrogenedens sp.]